MIEGFEVDLAVDRAGGEERLDLGPEVEPPVPLRVVQRLDADAIAREQQRAARPIPERDAEHAAQPPERRLAPLLVGVDDHFRVAGGVEARDRRPRARRGARGSCRSRR